MRHLTFFLRLFAWFCLRNMRNHRGRAIMVLLGIALGAAVFTSVRLSIHASLLSFTQSMDLIAGRADRVLVRPGGRVPERLLTSILKHPAVIGASPILSTYVQPADKTFEPFLLIGFDPILDRRFRPWELKPTGDDSVGLWLDLLKKPYSLVIAEPLSRQYGWPAGEVRILEHARQRVSFHLLGILDSQGLARVEGGRIGLTDIATFQEFTGLHGFVDRIDLLLKPAIKKKDLQSIRALLPADVLLKSPSESKESGQAMIRAYQLNLSILSFVSLFVGMFLVYSLVALNATSRRRELAILRSIGASPRLIFFLFLAEGAFFGIAGWLMAIPIGSYLVKYLLHGVSQTISNLFVRVQVDDLTLVQWELLLSLVVTVFIALLACFVPARTAMRVAPREILTASSPQGSLQKFPKRLLIIGTLCIFCVWPLSQLPGPAGMPLPGYVATFLLFAGFSLVSPWSMRKAGNAAAPMLRRLAGIPAYLAGRYIRGSGTRTAISVGALITAVALFTALVIMIHSFRQSVELWVHQTISADLYVLPKMAEINRYRDLFPQDVITTFKHLQTPVEILPFRRIHMHYGNVPYQFEVFDVEIFMRYGGFFWKDGDPERIRPRLRRGEGVLISEVFANQTGLGIGDLFQARIETAVLELPILGIVRDFRTQGGVVFYSLPHFTRRYADPGWSGIRFYFRDRSQDLNTAVANLRQEILQRTDYALDMISGEGLRQGILRVFDETFAITTVLLLIALIVAALGITTTLTILVLERSRQLNTLFAVGASFGQIRAMIFWEAAFMIVAGECGGLACGFILSHLLVFVINRQSFGWTFLYSVDWGALAMSLPLIFTTALMAALPAIRLVFREPPATLLRER